MNTTLAPDTRTEHATRPAAAMVTAGTEVAPIDPMERRIYQLEARILGLTKSVGSVLERQDTMNDEIRECLDRVYRVLDTTTGEEDA